MQSDEQGAAFAAEGYARIHGKVRRRRRHQRAGGYQPHNGYRQRVFRFIPCVYLSGQVNTYEYKGSLPVRQLGFQETDIVSIVKPIVKYAARVTDPSSIRYELERAFFAAQNGRKGPVLLDISMDAQRAQMEEDALLSNEPEPDAHAPIEIGQVVEALSMSSRPVLLACGGVRLSGVFPKFP